jgi:hypothetical protein
MRRETGTHEAAMPTTKPNTLVWHLFHPQLLATMDCVAYVRDDKQVEVLIQEHDRRQPLGVYGDAEAAIHAAFRFQDQMLASGWEKII